jgi:hypothetical protein
VKDFNFALPGIGRQKIAVTATGYDCSVFIRKLPLSYVEGLGTLDISKYLSLFQNTLVEMSTDIESLGLLFEIQWKKKPGGNNRDDVASIGIWDTPNASLDWVTFKSYVVSDGNVVL